MGPEEGEQILDILRSVSFDIEEMRKQESQLSPPDGMWVWAVDGADDL